MKDQRIRDPVHGLIVFSGSDPFDRLIWSLIDAPEFQRLRRIKQLGFSELVFPGATHTRFSHSVGVFHTARELVRLLHKMMGNERFSHECANVAICAALLHDLGHGPFSHTFEGAEKARGVKKKHEEWTAEIIEGDTHVGQILSDYDAEHRTNLRTEVANLLAQEFPSDIYASIVSSQFDADRLDYLRRDKLMTGTDHGGFDWAWLLNNLEIEEVTIGGKDDGDPLEVDALILGSKGLKAAEGYLLGRFHLYTQVYMHKTTRCAEKMLGEILNRLAELIAKKNADMTGLPPNHPLRRYLSEGGNTLGNYLSLDDTTIWGALPLLARSSDALLSELATRLHNRDLYKCIDIGARAERERDDAVPRFKRILREKTDSGEFNDGDVLFDEQPVSAYRFRDFESPDALGNIIIRNPDGSGRHTDVAKVSPVVNALSTENFRRAYARTPEVMTKLKGIWEEAKK